MSHRHRPLLAAVAIAALTFALGIGDRSDAQVRRRRRRAHRSGARRGAIRICKARGRATTCAASRYSAPRNSARAPSSPTKSSRSAQRGNDAQVERLREGGTAFLAERGVRSFRQTSLVVDPPNGRIPPLTASGQERTDAQNARRRAAAELVGGPQPL